MCGVRGEECGVRGGVWCEGKGNRGVNAADMLFSPALHSDQPQSDKLKVEVCMYVCRYVNVL